MLKLPTITQRRQTEAEETFAQLREDYQALRVHTDELESILRAHGIDYPKFS